MKGTCTVSNNHYGNILLPVWWSSGKSIDKLIMDLLNAPRRLSVSVVEQKKFMFLEESQGHAPLSENLYSFESTL